MRAIKDYTPPTPEALASLKHQLGYTGNEMADLAGVAGNSQWRKYTGGKSPRTMSSQTLFYMAAQLTLNEEELSRVLNKMKEIGATLA